MAHVTFRRLNHGRYRLSGTCTPLTTKQLKARPPAWPGSCSEGDFPDLSDLELTGTASLAYYFQHPV